MPFQFPPAPTYEGLEFLSIYPVFFFDARTGQKMVIPVYQYEEVATRELILVVEDHFEPILDKLIKMKAFPLQGARS